MTPARIYAYLGCIASNGASLETRHRRHRVVRFGARARELDLQYLLGQSTPGWCGGTRRPTMRRRRRGPTSGSVRRTGWGSG